MAWWRASLLDLGRSESGRSGGGRVGWADTAKALSIILLVYWTLEGTSVGFNRVLILVRMPLFFFVSGLFAWRVVVRTDLDSFVREKVGNLVYLYVLWAVIVFATTSLVAWAWWGQEIDPWGLASLFWQPYVPMWFFYGLAIAFLVAFLCRGLPIVLVTALALIAYGVVVASGDWLRIPAFERVVRYFPFFWLGLVFRPAVFAFVERHWRLWPLPLAVYFALSWALFDTGWVQVPPVAFAITAIGIGALLMLSAQLSRLPGVSGALAVVGASTLYIYATQHVTIFYLERAARFAGLSFEAVTLPVLVVVVAAGTLFGRWAARRPGFAWLFRAPWLGRESAGRSRAAPA